SCGLCDSCKALESGTHPDFQHIYKELVNFTASAKGRRTPVNIPIKVIREFLLEKVSSRPILATAKVYVISEAEKLNRESQNALLKILEEPPGYCFIVLLCTKPQNLLPTTRSRCQIIRFAPIDEEVIIEQLLKAGISRTQAQYWGRFTDGSIGQALTWARLEPAEGPGCFEIKKELLRRLGSCKLEDALDFAAWLSASVKEIAQAWTKTQDDSSKSDITRRVQRGLVRMIIVAVNDAMKLNISPAAVLTNASQAEDIKILARKIPAEKCASLIVRAYETLGWIDASVNEKLIFEQLLLNFTG
ncbi:MAG: hypothetical protein GWO86_03115, partial [Planctomycetes bacterium]|nr:hypothetical protein [Planctomycetota bacterium]